MRPRLMNFLLQWIKAPSADSNIVLESQLRRRVFDYSCQVVGRVSAKNTLSEVCGMRSRIVLTAVVRCVTYCRPIGT
jgi:hypothetical protein